MSSPGLVAEEDVDTSMKGNGVIVGERFVEEISSKSPFAKKSGLDENSQKEEDMGAFMAVAKGGKIPQNLGACTWDSGTK